MLKHKTLKNLLICYLVLCGLLWTTNWFLFLIEEKTKKNYRNLPNRKIHYYLTIQIPIMHGRFFKIISQNPEYVKTQCNDIENPFQFECRK